jgi:hypothetical protein
MSSSTRLTAVLPVSVAALLIGFCLTGAPLYSSSSGSAALGAQLDETCRTDSALILPVPPDHPGAEQRVAEIGAGLALVEPVQRLAVSTPVLVDESPVPRRLRLLWLDGAGENVMPPLRPLAPGEIAVSDNNLVQLRTAVGEQVEVEGARLTVAQSFDNVPFAPLPSFWCGFPELFEPTAGGDLPPPFAIASPETIESIGGASHFHIHPVRVAPLTLTDASEIEDAYAAAIEAWNTAFPQADSGVERNELARVVDRAQAVRASVDRNLAPVMLTGVVAGSIVLLAAAVLLARDRERELRLLAVRGSPLWRIGAHVAPSVTGAIGAGTIVGAASAWGAVTAFGPSSRLERSALTQALTWTAATMLLAMLSVLGVIAVVADGFADRRPRRVHAAWPAAAAVALMAALAVVAFRRLDRKGGVRNFGVESRGGDLLAIGFPLFALLAVTAAAALATAVVAARLRFTGRRLPRALRLGWRRVVLQVGPLAAVVVSIALASGCFSVANALAAGAQRQLADKAEVYVGSDLAVDVFDDVELPPGWTAPTTLVSKVSVKWKGEWSDVLGVDRATFASVARLRADGASLPLDQLVEAIEPDGAARAGGPLPAVAAGAHVAIGEVVELELPGGQSTVSVRVVALADFFPAKQSGNALFAVDRPLLTERFRFSTSALLIRDPPAHAIETIQATGVRTGIVRDPDDAFDGSAYSALRWAYAPLAALGALFAAVALALQLLVIAARRRERRIADVVMRRTGFRRRHLWLASVVETGLPMLLGALIGVAAAVLAARLAVERLDPMPSLAPPAQFATPWGVLAGVACAIPLWTALVAAAIVRSTTSADPMTVMQGAV